MRTLLIEDDPVLGAAVRDHIALNGHSVDWLRTIDEARSALATVAYELVLLDLGLPDGCGLALLRELRAARNPVPVIIATAQDQIAVRIEGLNAGADDYLVKPFDLSEMNARISAVARRYTGDPNPVRDIGPVSIDLARKRAMVNGKDAGLTAREWAVLERLVRHRGAIVTKGEIEDSLYEFGAEIESNAVEVYVSRLRRKLGKDFVNTVRGLGYQVEG
ncbi:MULTISPECIES: response regulator transcription factor [Cupriavidus]|uniref:response regulator transcription factor n=1 Tax=Cupriavidus TaxID=106589 RepID=UPI0003AB1A32|nr:MULTISPECIES: response regulator transcription factor [Cupriavidus]